MPQLTGQALLDALNAAPQDATEADRIRSAGYVSENGRLLRTSFYRNLAIATPEVFPLLGTVEEKSVEEKSMGRPLSYQAGVLRKGHAVICASYLQQIGAGPSSRLQIEARGKELVLTAITSDG